VIGLGGVLSGDYHQEEFVGYLPQWFTELMSNDALASPRTYAVLAAAQAADAVACAISMPFVTKALDDVKFPAENRWIFPVVKGASAIGLLSVTRFPALARLTTAMLTVYFALAVTFHLRARDIGLNAAAATTLMATFAAMTARGPSGPRRSG
jgi:hypothetical protein